MLDMMDAMPELEGRSHGGAIADSQAGRLVTGCSVNLLKHNARTPDNQQFRASLSQDLSCPRSPESGKGKFNSMTFRSIGYWFVCSVVAVIAVGAAEPDLSSTASFTPPIDAASAVQAVPEPGRALLLFVGIMAMAFTYRKAWLNWKRGSQG
jgi:hypothetical protein